jgi:transposase InsO family protein
MSSKKYTVVQAREALRLSEELGSVVASERMGIPRSSFFRLLREARQVEQQPVSTLGRVVAERALERPSTPSRSPSSIAPVGPTQRRSLSSTSPVDSGERRPPTSGSSPAAAERPAPAPATTSPPQPATGRRALARLYTPSQKAAAIELAASVGVSAASRQLGISRCAIRDWRTRLHAAAQGDGADPTSGPAPLDIEEQRDREILAVWREHPGLGPSQISNQLRRRGIKVAIGTTRKVLEQAGYRPKKVLREPHTRRYEAVRPNHVWHLDFVQRYIGKTSTFNLFLLDDHSRFVVGWAIGDAERADTVIEAFLDATTRHGRPEAVVHDRGSAFWSWNGISRFTELLTEMGIDQLAVQHKEVNGKSEVFNANLHKEFWDVQRFVDVASMRPRLAAHIDFYNHHRTHQSLGGLLVPADRYFGRVEQVLARIEQGGLADKKDPLDLMGRSFDPFRVTSQGGKPEVWLLGTKILGG